MSLSVCLPPLYLIAWFHYHSRIHLTSLRWRTVLTIQFLNPSLAHSLFSSASLSRYKSKSRINMCNKLFQTHACGHSKSICTTPCPHALRSAQRPTHIDTVQEKHLLRSNSTVSSITSAAHEHSAANFSYPQTHSPLRSIAPSAPTSPTHAPAFRFIAPRSASPTSSDLPVSLSFQSQGDRAGSPLSVEDPEPSLCAYYIPKYLFTSRYPCIDCYSKPEWEGMRKTWMENYRLGHPFDKVEDVEKLSGVEGIGLRVDI